MVQIVAFFVMRESKANAKDALTLSDSMPLFVNITYSTTSITIRTSSNTNFLHVVSSTIYTCEDAVFQSVTANTYTHKMVAANS